MNPYVIQCVDGEEKIMAYCQYDIFADGKNIESGTSDQDGKIYLREFQVKNKKLQIAIHHNKYPRGIVPPTDIFEWEEGVREIQIVFPKIYHVTLRETENKNNEPALYQRAYYEVKQGDTWDSISTQCNANVELIRWINQLSEKVELREGMKIRLPCGSRKQESSITQERSKNTGHPIDVVNKKIKCCCNRDITANELKSIQNSKTALEFLNALNFSFKKYNITNCIDKAFILANTMHETAGYELLEEILPKGVREEDVYDGYKGRGIMQLTWEHNYRNYGISIGKDFLGKNKTLIATNRIYAVESGVWFWINRELNNHSVNNDLITISAQINGGYNGFKERYQYYKKAIMALNVKFCENISEKIKSRLDSYIPFKESYVYQSMIAESFGWGLWHDPQTKLKGTGKNVNLAKEGYLRFLELTKGKDYPFGKRKNKNGDWKEKERYGYKGSEALIWAKKRLEEL